MLVENVIDCKNSFWLQIDNVVLWVAQLNQQEKLCIKISWESGLEREPLLQQNGKNWEMLA